MRARALVVACALCVVAGAGPVRAQPAPLDDRQMMKTAMALYEAGRVDDAIALVFELVDRDPQSPTARNAVELLLMMLERDRKIAPTAAWVEGMSARPSFVAAHARLDERVRWAELHLQQLRALDASNDGLREGDPAAYERCGELTRDALELPDGDRMSPALLYHGAWCFERAGSGAAAIELYERLLADHPTERYAPEALFAIARVHTAALELDLAAATLEAYALRYPASDVSERALRVAVDQRVALGELAAAELDVERWMKVWGGREPAVGAELALAMAEAYAERDRPGDRAAARRWARTASRVRWTPETLPPSQMLAALGLLRDAACPVAPRDELCVDGAGVARARDRELASASHGLAAMLRDGDDPDLRSEARRVLADELLERVLAIAAAPRKARARERLRGFARAARDAFLAIAEDPSATPAARIAAHARLGQLADLLAARTGGATGLEHYGRCQALATEHTTGPSWLALCDRAAIAGGDPDPRPRERLPAPAFTEVSSAPEPVFATGSLFDHDFD